MTVGSAHFRNADKLLPEYTAYSPEYSILYSDKCRYIGTYLGCVYVFRCEKTPHHLGLHLSVGRLMVFSQFHAPAVHPLGKSFDSMWR
jgi:hypothetical protein